MSALGHTFRYQVYNGTGGSVTVTLKDRRWKFASDGSLSWSAEATPINAVAVSTASYSNSSSIDNATTDKYLGAELSVLMDVSASVTGAVTVFLQHSTDGGTTWPSDGQGIVVGSYYFNASAVDVTRNYRV